MLTDTLTSEVVRAAASPAATATALASAQMQQQVQWCLFMLLQVFYIREAGICADADFRSCTLPHTS